jgi:DNA recombination protein RmuC
MFEVIFLIIGLVIGCSATWLIYKLKYEKIKGIPQSEVDKLIYQVNDLKNEKGKLEERNLILGKDLVQNKSDLENKRVEIIELNKQLSKLGSDYSNLQDKLGEQKSEIEEMQEKFTINFENLANKILEDKSKKFTEQNKTNISEILKPLNEKIKDFEKKVEETYDKESKQRFSLENVIKNLMELNKQMSEEANNLTNALKGQSKTQGNWGELILESILDKSGLVKGREYLIQESLTNEGGNRLQPDVVIHLPENKNIVIDSKVSLTAYERYCSSDNEDERKVFLKEHINSIRNHIKELSQKNYQDIYKLNTLDFVLMFIPIEPSFSLAIQNEWGILNEAFEKRIVMISTSTLLVTLKTISHLWRQEYQNKNALEIAKQGGDLYDKFVGFVNDCIDLGNRILGAQKCYEDLMSKLHKGKGNLVKRSQDLKGLGLKTTKVMPPQLLDRTDFD